MYNLLVRMSQEISILDKKDARALKFVRGPDNRAHPLSPRKV